MARIVDTLMAMRILYLLITPIENTQAYKLGLIDESGKTVRKAKSDEENNATSPLHRMVWNLKRLISLIPGGSTKIGSLAAGYLLMKECVANNWSEEKLNNELIENFNSLCMTEAHIDSYLDELSDIYEDAPANSSGAAVSTDVATKNLNPVLKRKRYKTIDLPET